MRKYIILACVVLSSIGLLSTLFTSCNRNTSRNVDDRGRRDVVVDHDGGSRSTGGSSTRSRTSCDRSTREGGGSCDGDADCEDDCDDLFNGRDYTKCLDMTVNEVRGMWNAFDEDDGILEDPDEDDLADVHPDDIKNALDIDENIWDDYIRDYGNSEANDVLYWIATDECIYNAIDEGFDEDDMKSLMTDIFLQADSSGLLAAALEPLGDEADDEETFLFLADQDANNDEAVDLVHELLWEECLAEIPTSGSARKDLYNRVADTDDRNSACLLGEVYCKQVDDEYIFEDVFENLVNNELDSFIRGGAKSDSNYRNGLGISSSDYDDLEEVCKVICGASGAVSSNQRIGTSALPICSSS